MYLFYFQFLNKNIYSGNDRVCTTENVTYYVIIAPNKIGGLEIPRYWNIIFMINKNKPRRRTEYLFGYRVPT